MNFKEELIEILKVELNAINLLKELTHKKTDIIIENRLEELEETTKKEEELINKIALLEEERLQLMDSWGVNKTTPLSQVIERIPEGKEELIEIREELSSILEEIKERNKINNELIMDNLEWLDFNMNLVSQVQTPTTYGNKDNKIGTNNSLFDRKV